MRSIGPFIRGVIFLKPESVLIATTYFHPIVAVGLVSFATLVYSFLSHVSLGIGIQSAAVSLLWLLTFTCFQWLLCRLFSCRTSFMTMLGAVSTISACQQILALPFVSLLNRPPSVSALSFLVLVISTVVVFWSFGMYTGTIAALSNSSERKAVMIGLLAVLMNWSFTYLAQKHLSLPTPLGLQNRSSVHRHLPGKSQSGTSNVGGEASIWHVNRGGVAKAMATSDGAWSVRQASPVLEGHIRFLTPSRNGIWEIDPDRHPTARLTWDVRQLAGKIR
ncbi:MAG: hypothetical protein HY318_06080 [Armatimonadetes bacterium]|nr:hypothetical protein [Armatimonadota bacterium]